MRKHLILYLLLASLTLSLGSLASAQVDLSTVDVSYKHTVTSSDSWNITLSLYDSVSVKPIRLELASIRQDVVADGTFNFYNRGSLCTLSVAPRTATGVLDESSMELDPKGIESWTNGSLPLRTTAGNGTFFECFPGTWKTSATENVVLTQTLNLTVGNPYEVAGFGTLMGTTMNNLNVPTMKGRTQTAVNSIRNLRSVIAVDPSTPWSPIMVASRIASLDFTIGKSGTTIPAEGKFSDAEFSGSVNGVDQTITGTRRVDNITEFWYENVNDSNSIGQSVTGDIYNTLSLGSDVLHELKSGLIMTSSVVSTLTTSASLTFVEGDPIKPTSTITLDLEHKRRTVVDDIIERTSDGLGAVPSDSGSYLKEDDTVIYSETWKQDVSGLESSIVTGAPVGLNSWVTDNRSISLTSSSSGKGFRTYTALADPFGETPFRTTDEFTTDGSAIISISENGKSQYLNSTSYMPTYAGGDPWYGTGVVGAYSSNNTLLPAGDFGSIRGYTYAVPWTNTSTTSSIYTKAIPQAKGGASSTTAINETTTYTLEGKNGENSLSITIEVFRTRDAVTGTILTEKVNKTVSEYRVYGPGDAHFGSLTRKSTVIWERVLESNDALSLFLAEDTSSTTDDTTSTTTTTTDDTTTSSDSTEPVDTKPVDTSVTNPLPVTIVPWFVGIFATAVIARRKP